MADMRLTSEEKKDFSTPSLNSAPRYPHGLRIHLNYEELKKLGFQSPPSIEDKFKLEGNVEVVSVDKSSDESEEFSITLQITDMEISKGKKGKDAEATTIIYGD